MRLLQLQDTVFII